METRARIPTAISDRKQSIALGTVFAILAVVLVVVYVKNYRHDVNAKGDVVPVLVATGTIPAGTPASGIAGRVQLEHIIRGDLASGAVASLGGVKGMFASENIYPGDQITLRRFRPLAALGLKGAIGGRLRIVEITGDPNQVLSGTLQAGDHVDVVASIDDPVHNGLKYTHIVLRNIKVLTTPEQKKQGAFSSSKGNTAVQLQLTDKQAQQLYWLTNNAFWTFVIRPRKSVARNSKPSIDSWKTILATGFKGGGNR
jgi:Flp pilus assembly protein CpaB